MFTNINLGILLLSASSSEVSVPTERSVVPSTMIMAPSAAARPDSSSPKKSEYPGISRKLNFKDWYSTVCKVVSLLILTASLGLEILVVSLAVNSRASVILLFPAPLCPKIATFLILSLS